MFVVDEVYCIFKWGVSFWLEYEMLFVFFECFFDVVIGVFMVMVDEVMCSDIVVKLFGGEGDIVLYGFD